MLGASLTSALQGSIGILFSVPLALLSAGICWDLGWDTNHLESLEAQLRNIRLRPAAPSLDEEDGVTRPEGGEDGE